MSDIKRILVPTDFSGPADAALGYAIGLATKLEAHVSLIHVFDDPVATGLYAADYMPMPMETRAELLADLRKRLEDLTAKSGYAQVAVDVLIGPTAKVIVEAARDRNVDLIVMGTHGRHGMAHLLLGSIAERVVRTASCPVLTVRSPSGA
jgi:universal stress protein A